jgi:hypothetical protein
VHVAVPTPTGAVAASCRSLVAALPDDLVLGQHRVTATPASPYTAAFGSPPVTVRCGGPLPAHQPTSLVENVNGVDWLLLPTSHDTEHYVAYTAATHLAVDIPHAYLPANVLPALSPLVSKYG